MSKNLVSSPFHFFSCNDFFACLVCKETISRQLGSDFDSFISNHINTKNHQDNVKDFFKFCLPHWEGSDVDFVQNLVFDVSIEEDKSSYVSKVNNHIYCFLCEESIVKLSDTKDCKKTSLINHIQSESHLTKLKTVSWIYDVDDEYAFVMLCKSVSLCSICKKTIESPGTCPVKRIVQHLRDFHPNKMLKDIKNTNVYETQSMQVNTISYADLTELCHLFDKLSILEGKPLSFTSLSGNVNQPLDNCSKFENSVGSDIDSDIEKSFSNLADFQRGSFTCPECGEPFTVYNENVDFSLDLHMQTHMTLPSISANDCLNYQEDADYVCPICQETIQVFNKDLEISFNLHFDNNHGHDKLPSAKFEVTNKFDFLSRVFENLSENMQEQQTVFTMDGNEVICKLCNCVVSASKHVPDACEVFTKHLLNSYHVDQYNISVELTKELPNKKPLYHKETNYQNNLFERFTKKCPIIERNKQFIQKQEVNYLCTVCMKNISYSPKEDTQILNIVSHLKSYIHYFSVKDLKQNPQNIEIHKRGLCTSLDTVREFRRENSYNPSKELKNKSLSKDKTNRNNSGIERFLENPIIESNKQFLKIQQNGYFCSLCNRKLSSKTYSEENSQIFNLVQHFKGALHNKNLLGDKVNKAKMLLTEFTMSNQQNPQNIEIHKRGLCTSLDTVREFRRENSHNPSKELKNKSLSKDKTNRNNSGIERFLENPIIESNKQFLKIQPNGYFCSLCNRKLSSKTYSEENSQIFNLVQHFKGALHNKNLWGDKVNKAKMLLTEFTMLWEVVRKNVHLVQIKNNGNFLCTQCNQEILCSRRGKLLKNHFMNKTH